MAVINIKLGKGVGNPLVDFPIEISEEMIIPDIPFGGPVRDSIEWLLKHTKKKFDFSQVYWDKDMKCNCELQVLMREGCQCDGQ